tara:strand:+ start:3806 stop:4006 length:201 start_codon:yes stop_codon:yes gene_type:complete
MPKFNMLVKKSCHYYPDDDIVIEAADAEEAEEKVQYMSDHGEIEWEDWGIEDTVSIEAEEISEEED